jgi:hypothetical protein
VRYMHTLSDAGMIVTLILAFADYRRWHDIGLKVATMSRPRNGGRTPRAAVRILVPLTNRGVYPIGFDRRATGWRTANR